MPMESKYVEFVNMPYTRGKKKCSSELIPDSLSVFQTSPVPVALNNV